jgi:hypothetical protein
VSQTTEERVVKIIGGGIIGCCVTFELIRRGSKVTIPATTGSGRASPTISLNPAGAKNCQVIEPRTSSLVDGEWKGAIFDWLNKLCERCAYCKSRPPQNKPDLPLRGSSF